MKKALFFLIFIFNTIISVITAFANVPAVVSAGTHVTMSASNCIQTTANCMTIDLYIVNDGSSTLTLNSIAYGLNANAAILNGGALSWNYLSGTSDLTTAITGSFDYNYNSTFFELRLQSSPGAIGYNTAPALPGGKSVHVGTFTICNSQPWTTGSATNFALQTSSSPGLTITNALVYVNGATTTTVLDSTGINRDVSVNCSIPLNTVCPSSPSASNNGPVCQGGTIQLNSSVGSGSTPLSYAWKGPNSYSSSLQNPSLTAASISAGGTYSVTIANSCGSTSTTTSITVKATSSSSNSITACNLYIWNGTTYLTSGPEIFHSINAAGCDSAATLHLTINTTCPATLSLKLFIQGYYKSIGSATPMNNLGSGGCLYICGISSIPTEADTITISLMDPNTQSQAGASIKGILHTDGSVWQNGSNQVTLSSSVIGKSYYIKITHRSAIETWSGTPILFGSTTSYDFSTPVSKAFGSNMIQVDNVNGHNIYALWSGDVYNANNGISYAQDGVIESADYGLVEEDYTTIRFGYYTTDITGDGIVESADYGMIEHNYTLIIFKVTPW